MSATTDRALAACGLGYPLLTVIGFAAFAEPPGGDVSAAHDPAWLAAHTGSVIAQSYVRGVGALAFLVLAVAVGRAVARSGSGGRPGRAGLAGLAALATAGGVACGALLLAAQTTMLAAALATRDGVAGSAVRVLDSLDQALLSVSSLPAILLFAAAGTAWLGSSVVPGWFAVLTLAGVPLGVLDTLGYPGSPVAAVGIAGLAYFLVWGLAAAICLARGGRGADAAALATAHRPDSRLTAD